MRLWRRVIVGAAGAAILGTGGFLAVRAAGAPDEPAPSPSASATPTEEPVYYVEGARPSPGASKGAVWVEDGEAPPGCVPYSPDRGGWVCGELPSGFEPPAPPGYFEDYPETCAVAKKIVEARAERVSRELQLPLVFEIDPDGCVAWGMGAGDEGRWAARFPLAHEVVSPEGEVYRTVVVWEFTLEGMTVEGYEPPVFLSSEPTVTEGG